MPRSFISQQVDNLFRDALEGVMADLGKKATFVIVLPRTTTPCPNCIFDPIHKVGSGIWKQDGPQFFAGKICPVCENKGVLVQDHHRKVPNATVAWSKINNQDANTLTRAGELPYGHARIKMPVRYYDLISKAEAFTVDNRRCRIVGTPKRRGLKSYVAVEIVVRLDD